MKQILGTIVGGESLSEQESIQAFETITKGDASAGQIGAFLMGLSLRGESVAEIIGAVRALRAQSLKIDSPPGAIDVCGTGGDRKGTVNISTAVGLVVAGCGVAVAKHGNRAISSRSGSADVLRSLGVNIESSIESTRRCLWECGLCFLLAPLYHPGMKNVGPIRADLGFRTVFNILGPLINPAEVRRQVIGVFSPEWVEPIGQVLLKLGIDRAWIVHGHDGMDELTTTSETTVIQIRDHTLSRFAIRPEDVGLERRKAEELRGGSPEENAQAILDLLRGHPGPYREIVLLNSAAALLIADKVATLQEGVVMAAQAIDNGAAFGILERLITLSHA